MSFWDQFGLGGPSNSPGGGDQGMGGWSDTSGGLSPSSVTAGGGLAGLGLGALGTIESLGASEKEAGYQSKAAAASGNIAALDMQANTLKMQYQTNMTRRLITQQFRNAQQKRAQSLAAGINQGTSGTTKSSGVAGGMSAVSAGAGYNVGGLTSDLNAAQQMFGIMQNEDLQKIAIANYQSQAATAAGSASMWSGIASLGGDIMKAAPFAAALI